MRQQLFQAAIEPKERIGEPISVPLGRPSSIILAIVTYAPGNSKILGVLGRVDDDPIQPFSNGHA